MNETDADPIIGENAIHWLICIQTYEASRAPVLGINQDWFLGYQDLETCVYHRKDLENFVLKQTIIGFRGTAAMKDVKDDIKLSIGGSQTFPRAEEGISFVQEYLDENPELMIQLTGHSLGGAIARHVGQVLGLGIITFNAAAPPSNPVITGPNEIDYHIVFDIISAWQYPNTVRIDKGYRPIKNRSLIPLAWADKALKEMYQSHSLSNFSKERQGVVITAEQENKLFKIWFYSLPLLLKKYVTYFLLGVGGKIKLPEIQ
jgi:hypothetical protein